MHALQDKCKHIQNAKKYASEQVTSLWDVFFKDQEEIVDNCRLSKSPSHGLYNSIVILRILFLHLMRLMLACSIHHKGTYMLDQG